jgi:hypothetical protein
MNFFKKILKPIKPYTPFLSGITAGIISNYIFALLSKLPGSFGEVFTKLDRFIKMKISMEIPVIVLLTIAVVLIHYFVVIILKIINHFRKPPYLQFTSMDYKDWKIVWEYEYLPKYKRYNIKNIRPVCKICGCDLVNQYTALGIDGIMCPICEKLYPSFMHTTAVEKIIEHEIAASLSPPKDQAKGKK